MNRPIKRLFTKQEIVRLLLALGSAEPHSGAGGELIFQTVCHHGASYKLYYYPNTGRFHCYTRCSAGFDAYQLVMRSRGCTFTQALRYVNSLFGLSAQMQQGFVSSLPCADDWSLFARYKPQQAVSVPELTVFPPTLPDYYLPVCPVEWLREGITPQSMRKYHIRFDAANNKIIIPQYSPKGELVGIRGRALDPYEVADGKKYMPVTLEGTILRAPTAYVLYGLYQNRNAIRRCKKVLIFEAEKSVLKCDSFYGDGNFTVAVCGSSISHWQRAQLLALGVKEVFLAFDKDYHAPFTPESDAYAEKILALAHKFSPYVTTYVLWDTQNLLAYKSSPADHGQEILEQLMKQKYEVTTLEDEWKIPTKNSATPN